MNKYSKASASCTSAMIQLLLRQGQICGVFPTTPGTLLAISSQLGKIMAGKKQKAMEGQES
jgi:hypothetical protein